MSLISCKECSNKISDKAQSCPHCGAAVIGKSSSHIEGMDAILLLVSCIVGVILAGLTTGLTMRLLDEDKNPGLQITLGVVSMAIPPAAVLVWSSRRKF